MFLISLMALAASAQADAANGPRAARGDEAQWITANDYPPSAIRAHQEGTVTIRFTIGRDGKVHDCVATVSSGVAALDEAACRAVTTRGAYDPARDAQGRPIATTKTRRVNWSLPKDRAGSPLASYAWSFVIRFDKTGAVAGCESVSSGSPTPQPQDACVGFAGALRPMLGAAKVDAKGITVRLDTVQSLGDGSSADQAPDGYRVLRHAQIDFTVLTDGRAADCEVATNADFTQPFMATPCAGNARFFTPTWQPLTLPVAVRRVETIAYRRGKK